MPARTRRFRRRRRCSEDVESGFMVPAFGSGSGDLDLADLDRHRAPGEEVREQREGRGCVVRLYAPPERVPACEACGRRPAVAQWAREPRPGGECSGAFRRGVLVLEEEERHASRVPELLLWIIRETP